MRDGCEEHLCSCPGYSVWQSLASVNTHTGPSQPLSWDRKTPAFQSCGAFYFSEPLFIPQVNGEKGYTVRKTTAAGPQAPGHTSFPTRLSKFCDESTGMPTYWLISPVTSFFPGQLFRSFLPPTEPTPLSLQPHAQPLKHFSPFEFSLRLTRISQAERIGLENLIFPPVKHHVSPVAETNTEQFSQNRLNGTVPPPCQPLGTRSPLWHGLTLALSVQVAVITPVIVTSYQFITGPGN